MQATADSLAFTPPPEPAAIRGFVLAVIAHLLLVIALSLGINWDKDTPAVAVEAELWSAVPQQAAPPPAPPPPRVVQAPPVVQAPAPPVTKEPDIALEREKKRKEQEAKRRQEEEQQRKLEEQQQRKLEAQRRKLEEQQRLADERKLREEQAKKEKQKKELDAKKLEQQRKETLARLMAEAGTGAPTSRGTAAKASGPSDSYAGRIRARVKPNIVFSDDVPGNPSADVEVNMAPDGTIVSRKVTKSSGVKSWDEAVLRALDKTEVLPRDIDGRVHTPLIIEFKLRG
jgi:colicin import membrane protein